MLIKKREWGGERGMGEKFACIMLHIHIYYRNKEYKERKITYTYVIMYCTNRNVAFVPLNIPGDVYSLKSMFYNIYIRTDFVRFVVKDVKSLY